MEYVVILPFRHHIKKKEYMVRREKISTWDEKSDLCIMLEKIENESPESVALALIEKHSGFTLEESKLIDMGVLASDRTSGDIYHIFSTDLSDRSFEHLPTHFKNNEFTFWCDEEKVLSSVDAMLIATYARIKFLT
jgi:hypothetical protein